jgi:transketolase
VDILEAILDLSQLAWGSPDLELVLSKGHAAPALYGSLAEHGFLPFTELESFGKPGSRLEEHPNHLIPGVSHPSGALGHGLPFGAGFVLPNSYDGRQRKAFVVLSDGECNEGTVWESAIFAGSRSLTGLAVVVDANGWQATGRTNETFGIVDIGQLFLSAGWDVTYVDGHSIEELKGALMPVVLGSTKPLCVIAKTVKGKGVSFMEDDNNWHYRTLTDAEARTALTELGHVS